MNIADVLDRNTMAANVKIKGKEQLLETVAELACKSPLLANTGKEAVLHALKQREELASTALGSGVAVPHCRIKGLEKFISGLVTTSKKIDYSAPDNEKVDIFPFVIGPEDNPREHLKVLSGMARLLRNPDTRKTIRSADSADQLFSFLTDITADREPDKAPEPISGMKMLHVFVRSEELFNDILQVFASGEFTGAMVLEAHESTEYMSSMPVFAGFWNSELNTFNRIITAVVQGSLLNQTMRNLEYVCGDLKNQNDLMVTVSDLHHVIGSLDF